MLRLTQMRFDNHNEPRPPLPERGDCGMNPKRRTRRPPGMKKRYTPSLERVWAE